MSTPGSYIVPSTTPQHNSNHKCELCDKCYSSATNLNKHIKNKHTVENYDIPQYCLFCSKLFANKIKLAHHIKGRKRNGIFIKGCGQKKQDERKKDKPEDIDDIINHCILDDLDDVSIPSEGSLPSEISDDVEDNSILQGYNENFISSINKQQLTVEQVAEKINKNNTKVILVPRSNEYLLGCAKANIDNIKSHPSLHDIACSSSEVNVKNMWKQLKKRNNIIKTVTLNINECKHKDSVMKCSQTCIWSKRHILFYKQQILLGLQAISELKITKAMWKEHILAHLKCLKKHTGDIENFVQFLKLNFSGKISDVITYLDDYSKDISSCNNIQSDIQSIIRPPPRQPAEKRTIQMDQTTRRHSKNRNVGIESVNVW